MRLNGVELYIAAEESLGGQIAPDEMLRAEPYARRKLDYINDRYGTSHGDDYLAILIAETVRANRFSEYTHLICKIRMEGDPDRNNGTKKEPRPEARPLNHTHIVSRPV